MTMTTDTPAHLVMAKDFMARKGLERLEPVEVQPEGPDLWYCYYRLPQGLLELEVFYNRLRDDWELSVTAFPAAI